MFESEDDVRDLQALDRPHILTYGRGRLGQLALFQSYYPIRALFDSRRRQAACG